jgi:hypothetical protein
MGGYVGWVRNRVCQLIFYHQPKENSEMKKQLCVWTMAILLTAGVQMSFAVDSAAKKEKTPGAIVVESVTGKAKVTAVDSAKRTVTFDMDGMSRTVTCGPEVRNFDQIKVGDMLKVTFAESVAVYLQKAGAPAGGEAVSTVAVAPKGAKPGVLIADSIVLQSKIDDVNAKKRTVTITMPDGKSRTLKVAKGVKGLKDIKKGDDVNVRFTEALAITIETPAP